MRKKIISVAIFFFSAVVFSQEPKNLGSLFYKEVTADIETEPVFVADDAADDMCVLENKLTQTNHSLFHPIKNMELSFIIWMEKNYMTIL